VPYYDTLLRQILRHENNEYKPRCLEITKPHKTGAKCLRIVNMRTALHPGDINGLFFVVKWKQESRTYYTGQVDTKCVA